MVEPAATGWDAVPAILSRIVPPTFPERDFVVTNYGAIGDGIQNCTPAFRDAIEACHQAGGGRVVVPPGKYSTGAIRLKSNVNLHLAAGSVIQFATDPAQYLPPVFTRFECTEVMNYSPLVYAFEAVNVAITGSGTLDGQGAVWHQWRDRWGADIRKLVAMGRDGVPVAQRVFGAGHYLRPNFVQPARCRNVLIEGITLVNSPMWTLHPLYCTNVTIRGVTVNTTGPNTDGCDPDSCTDVLIKDCRFSDGDDCIAIKSGRDEDGRRVNIPCQDIVVQGCTFKEGHGGVTLGSETAGGIRNVFAENCAFDCPDLNMAMRFKTGPARGGFIEDVFLRNCTVKAARTGINLTMRYDLKGDAVPVVRHIDIRDSRFANLNQAIVIEGLSPSAVISDVTISNCTFDAVKRANTVTNAARLRLLNTRINGAIQ